MVFMVQESKVLFYEPNLQSTKEILRSLIGIVEEQGDWVIVHRRDGDWKIRACKVLAIKPVRGVEVCR